MPIRYQVKDHIATITLDNPPVNVWTPELHKEFYDCLVEFLADDNVHVGVFTAAGDRAFSAGDDLKTPRPEWSEAELSRRFLKGMRKDTELGYPGWEYHVAQLPRNKPIIGAVNGPTIGQGFVYLDVLTDIRIASEKASFGMVEIAHGMGGAAGALQLGHSIAHIDAMYLALTGEMIDAEKACAMRFVNEVVPHNKLMSRAMKIANKIAAHPRLAVQVEMEAYSATKTMNAEQAMNYANQMFRILRPTVVDPLPFQNKDKSHD